MSEEQIECIWNRIHLGPCWRRWLWRLVYGRWIAEAVGTWKDNREFLHSLKETDR